MNSSMLLDAIGNISDKHVVEFADVMQHTSVKKVWKGIAAMAACLVLVFTGVKLFNLSHEKRTIPPLRVCTIYDSYYEIVDDKKSLAKHGLTDVITSEMLGQYICTSECPEGGIGNKGNIYDYNGYPGVSVLIFEVNSKYNFLIYCNPFTVISFQELLEVYGLFPQETVTNITVGEKNVDSKEKVGELMSALLESKALEPDSVYTRRMSSPPQRQVVVTISGEKTDSLDLIYYPDENLFYKACNFYELTPQAVFMMESLI